MAMDEKGLGKRIQLMRKKAGLTQQELCSKTAISYSTLTKIERGAIRSPSVFTIQGIARSLNITLDELLGEVTPVSSSKPKRTSPSGVKFVYFDVNGCLVRSFQEAFDILSKEANVPKDIIQTTFEHYNEAVCKGSMSLDQFNEAMARQVGRFRMDWASYYMRAVQPVAGMADVLREVASSYQVGLLTNTMPTLIESMINSDLIPNLPYEAIIESCNIGMTKPDPRVFALATQQVDRMPAEILLIDDTKTNLLAAKQGGWQTLWFDDYDPAESIKQIKQLLDLK